MKKRIIALVLAVLLVATATLILVACDSGVKTEEDWNDAMESFKTADAVTVTLKDNAWRYNRIGIFESHVKYDVTVSFDAEMSVVAITRKSTNYTILGIPDFSSTYEMYYVLDGTNVVFYSKYISEYSNDWKRRTTMEFDTVDEAMEYLRQLYITPGLGTSPYGEQDYLPNFTELSYYDFDVSTWGKFEYETTIDNRTHSYTLNFANGKPSKFTYDTEVSGELADKDSYSVSINYSAKITLPSDLPTEDF